MRFTFVVSILCFVIIGVLPLSSQSAIISNQNGKAIGKFETKSFMVVGSSKMELDPNNGKANFNGASTGSILIRLENLKWLDKEFEKKSLSILKSKIRIRKDEGMEVSSSQSKFRLSPKNEEQVDIYFEAVENGSYRIEFPFSASGANGRIARSITIEGLSGNSAKIEQELSVEKEAEVEDVTRSEAKDAIDRNSKKIEKAEGEDFSFEFSGSKTGYDLTWEDEEVVSITLNTFPNAEIETLSHPSELEVINSGSEVFKVKMLGSKPYFIKFKGDEGLMLVEFDNSLIVRLEEYEDAIEFTVKGGIRPYTVEFLKAGEEIAKAESRFSNLTPDKDGNIKFLYSELSNHLGGLYTSAIVSDQTTETRIEMPIDMAIEKKKGYTNLIIYGLVGLVLLGGILMLMSQKKKKKRRDAYREKARIIQQTEEQKIEVQSPKTEVVSKPVAISPPKKITIQKAKVERTPLGFSPVDKSPKTYGNMKIKWRESKGGKLDDAAFTALLKAKRVHKIDLSEHWADSTVRAVYIGADCIKDLGRFLKEENLSKMQSELQGAIPEVGGFLMGNHCFVDDVHIDVIIDEFVPFVPEYHDVFKIEIGTQTLVQELGDAQDKHPTMDVIGWFHTHPGHGLFLSNSDLSVQKHFSQPYQIAMEIDSLTERLDTAFFSRKSSGRMNNVEHRKKGTQWFTWKKIENV